MKIKTRYLLAIYFVFLALVSFLFFQKYGSAINLSLEKNRIEKIPQEAFVSEEKLEIFEEVSIINLEIEKSRREIFLEKINSLQELSEEKLLAVPFVCQNPFQNESGWKFHDNSCEEAAVYQAVLYLRNETVTAEEAHNDFLKMIEWQKLPENFGEHKDISRNDLKIFTEKYFNFDEDEVFFFEEFDENFIKKVLNLNLPIVFPTKASELRNPFFHEQDFHMLTIIGYTKNKVITNDVGTKRGEKYPYDWATIMKSNKNDGFGGGILIIWPKDNF